MTTETPRPASENRTVTKAFDWGAIAALVSLHQDLLAEQPATLGETLRILGNCLGAPDEANPPVRLLAYLQCDDPAAALQMLTTMHWAQLEATVKVFEAALDAARTAWDERTREARRASRKPRSDHG